MDFKIQLCDMNKQLIDAWKIAFKNMPFVSIHHGSILHTKTDCIVSPANSFGYMDGGIDLAYTKHFGIQLQQTVQDKIKNEYFGELMVGQAILVKTGDLEIKYLISAPTMRIPTKLPQDSDNVYLAMRAILICCNNVYPYIKTLSIPGLATGIGGISPESCAAQMKHAIKQVYTKEIPYIKNSKEAFIPKSL